MSESGDQAKKRPVEDVATDAGGAAAAAESAAQVRSTHFFVFPIFIFHILSAFRRTCIVLRVIHVTSCKVHFFIVARLRPTHVPVDFRFTEQCNCIKYFFSLRHGFIYSPFCTLVYYSA